MMRSPFISLLAAGLFALATGCSSPQESATTPGSPAAAAPAAAAERTPGTRADSLGGIPGHKFGEPLSAFPGLKPLPDAQQQPGCKTYGYPEGKGEPGWFGKRKRESPGTHLSRYGFRNDRFVSFAARAWGQGRPVLHEQALYLFGAGTLRPNATLIWEGQQVLASTENDDNPGMEPGEWLLVDSQDFVRLLATEKADKLKAENAQ